MGKFFRSFGAERRRAESWQERHDAPTSRRRVNEKRNSTSGQRREVGAISTSPSLKSKRDQKSRGIEKRTNEGTESRAAATQISGEETYFCIFFFSDKIADVL